MTNVLLDVIGSVLQVVLVSLLGLLFAWIRSHMKNERLSAALETLENAAILTVSELEQTTVQGLKAAHSDGKLTQEEIKSLEQQAYNLVIGRMASAAQETIKAAGMSIEDMVKAHVEAAVLNLKKA